MHLTSFSSPHLATSTKELWHRVVVSTHLLKVLGDSRGSAYYDTVLGHYIDKKTILCFSIAAYFGVGCWSMLT